MRKFCCLAVLTLTFAACGSDESATGETGSTTGSTAVDEATATTVDDATATTVDEATATTVDEATTVDDSTATTVGPSTATIEPAGSDPGPVDTTGPASEPCERPTSTEPVRVDFPMGMSSLVGRGIRTGAHPCYERVVLELQGQGEMPGYRVEYVVDPVKLSPSDLEVDIAGAATLVLSVAVWMTTMEGAGYEGPDQITPTNVEVIDELRLIENFEGMHQWAIGLDRARPFSVTTLTGPPRIVIDIAR